MSTKMMVEPSSDSDVSDVLEEGMFIVEKILDKKIVKGGEKFLVKWKDYDDSENSWEPAENLSSCKKMIKEFEETQEKREKAKRSSLKTESKLTPKKKARLSTGISKEPQHEVPNREELPVYVESIIGMSREEGKSGKLNFLVQFSDKTVKLIEKSEAYEKFPLPVIHFFEKHIVFIQNQATPEDKNSLPSNTSTDILSEIEEGVFGI